MAHQAMQIKFELPVHFVECAAAGTNLVNLAVVLQDEVWLYPVDEHYI